MEFFLPIDHMFSLIKFTKQFKRSTPKTINNKFLYRNCIGQNFAMNEMKVVMSATLRRFKLTVDESKPAPQLVPKLVLRSSTGVHIKFEQL